MKNNKNIKEIREIKREKTSRIVGGIRTFQVTQSAEARVWQILSLQFNLWLGELTLLGKGSWI